MELAGGMLLIPGLLSRPAALLMAINLTVATLLVKVDVGLGEPVPGRTQRSGRFGGQIVSRRRRDETSSPS